MAKTIRFLLVALCACLPASANAQTVQAFMPAVNGTISAITPSTDGEILYFGGTFTMIGGEARNGLAAVNANTGAVLAWNPAPTLSGSAGTIIEIVVVDEGSNGSDEIYVGGTFDTIGGESRNAYAKLDEAGAVVSGWVPAADIDAFEAPHSSGQNNMVWSPPASTSVTSTSSATSST